MEENINFWEQLARALAVFAITSWMFPYRCKSCGKRLVKLSLGDLSNEERQDYLNDPFAAAIFEAHIYQCPDQYTGEDKAYMAA